MSRQGPLARLPSPLSAGVSFFNIFTPLDKNERSAIKKESLGVVFPSKHMSDKISNGVKFMLGTKGRMTQVFDDKGLVTPATIVTAGPLTVTQVKAQEKDGYAAVQVGFGAKKESRVNKAQTGKPFRYFREFPLEAESSKLEAAQVIDISIFAAGDVVEVSAVSKGKGFQGVVKRHGVHGGPRSHGQKNRERSP